MQAVKSEPISQDIGILLYHLASKIKNQVADKIPFVTNYIIEKKLDTVQRIDAALTYLLANINNDINITNFEDFCGIGVIILPEQIEEEVEKVLKAYKNEILEKR